MQVLRDAPLGHAARLERLYAGDVFLDAPQPATREVVRFLWRLLTRAYSEGDPREAHLRLPSDEHFGRLTDVRREVLQSPETLFLLREVLQMGGWPLERTYFDLLRVRGVVSGAERNPDTAQAYLPHRDTWYANPPAQINLWIAVSDVGEDEAFAFWPAHWEGPVANDSETFDYARWQEYGGWQTPDPRKRYPTVLEAPRGPELRVAAPSGACLAFSGTHLHGTRAHASGRTRFSVEFRVVLLDDLFALLARRLLDSRAVGTTLLDFLRASDFAPFPKDLAERHARLCAERVSARARPGA